MSPTNTIPSSGDFCHSRRKRTLHRMLHILLSLSLVILLNLIAAKRYARYDLTEENRFSLAPETRHYLENLPTEAHVYVLLPEGETDSATQKVSNDIEQLLREFTHASRRNGKAYLRTEFVDIYRQRARAQELASQYQLTQETTIVVASGERYREILGTDLYLTREGEPVAFRGETVFLEALLSVTQEHPRTLYFLAGHGEMRPDDSNPVRGLSQLSQFLHQRNVAIKTLDLTETLTIPDDADLLVLAAPRTPLQPRQEDALRAYLSQRNGRLMVFLKAGAEAGIDELLYEWGILADRMAVVGTGADFQAQGGDLIVRNFASHPITQFLIDNRIPVLMGLTQSVRPDPGAPTDERRETLALLASAGKDLPTDVLLSWAKPYWSLEGDITYNPKLDLPGPVSVAVISQQRTGSGLGLNIPGGKLIVFGNADFIANNTFQTLGNSFLIHNTLSWLFEENPSLEIPPRPLERYKLTLSRGQTRAIILRILLIPLIIGIFGFLLILYRRR